MARLAHAVSIALLATLLAAPAAAKPKAKVKPATVGATFAKYYRTHYSDIKQDVLAWHGTSRNGCVAFVSTALRHAGIAIPQDVKRLDANVSRITYAFADYLEHDLAWARSEDPATLQPGDLIFTTGWPDHVYVFVSWHDRKRTIVDAIDNNGNVHNRPVAGDVKRDLAAYAYALRPVKVKSE